MADDVVPMPKMFKACYEVFRRELVPLHYARLTELALADLGLSKKDVNWHRQIEDVREKMLLAGQYNTFYVGAPYCLGGVRWWFETRQLRLFHPTPGILIPGNVSWGIEGAFEALMRLPHLKKKTHAPPERWMRGIANGYVVEKTVNGWFRQNYPDFYLLSDNEGKYGRYCFHDFKLCVDGRIYEVDISGPHLNGEFGNPGGGKRPVDFHLLGEPAGKDVLWKAVIPGKQYNSTILPDSDGICPERMVAWLNCKRDGIDYEFVRKHLNSELWKREER